MLRSVRGARHFGIRGPFEPRTRGYGLRVPSMRRRTAMENASASLKTIDDQDDIATMYASAARAWPGVKLDFASFAAAVDELRSGGVPLVAIHAADLYLARACASHVPGAARALDEGFLARVGVFVRRVDR